MFRFSVDQEEKFKISELDKQKVINASLTYARELESIV